MPLRDIDFFVIVLLENRSFDHVSGYLSLPTAAPTLPINGLSANVVWQQSCANLHNGRLASVHPIDWKAEIKDPPHDLKNIAEQINTPPRCGPPAKMGGFAATYANVDCQWPSPSMGYYSRDDVPMFDFFARNFLICDRWFSSLPTGTQPNRLMAMSGRSDIADNVSLTNFPRQKLIYDWLTEHGVNWCAYTCALPFFSLMYGWRTASFMSLIGRRSHTRFRRFSKFREQWSSGDGVPNVIFIEPRYTDDPASPWAESIFGRISRNDPNDDHPPTKISAGQRFLADIYQTLIGNPGLWKRTLMLVTYDEHGGFFDHETPLDIWTPAGGHDFETSGVRVPAFVVSPHVAAGAVFSGLLEHTSVLQFLADRFTPGQPYSPAIQERLRNYTSLVNTLQDIPQGDPPPRPPDGLGAHAPAPPRRLTARGSETARAFDELAVNLAIQYPAQLVGRQWHQMAQRVLDLADNRRSIPTYPAPRVGPDVIRFKQRLSRAARILRVQRRRPGSAMIGGRYLIQQRSLADRLRLRLI